MKTKQKHIGFTWLLFIFAFLSMMAVVIIYLPKSKETSPVIKDDYYIERRDGEPVIMYNGVEVPKVIFYENK